MRTNSVRISAEILLQIWVKILCQIYTSFRWRTKKALFFSRFLDLPSDRASYLPSWIESYLHAYRYLNTQMFLHNFTRTTQKLTYLKHRNVLLQTSAYTEMHLNKHFYTYTCVCTHPTTHILRTNNIRRPQGGRQYKLYFECKYQSISKVLLWSIVTEPGPPQGAPGFAARPLDNDILSFSRTLYETWGW